MVPSCRYPLYTFPKPPFPTKFLLLKLWVAFWSSLNWNLFMFPRLCSSRCQSRKTFSSSLIMMEGYLFSNDYAVIFVSYLPLASKNICWLCLCFRQKKKPYARVNRQMQSKLRPMTKAILWPLCLLGGWESKEVKNKTRVTIFGRSIMLDI